MTQKLIPLVLFLILVVFLGIGLTRDPSLVPSPLIDKHLPEFSLEQVKNIEKTFSSVDLHGHVSLLNVWASWCVACRSEHPILLKLAQTGLVNIYGLNYKDQREDAIRWLDHYGDPYTTSAYDHTGKIGIEYGVYGVPETFVIDKKGFIRYKHIGPVTENILEKKILPIIEQLKAASI
jgi:cytochrome c biogenesis protein CcmG, thiol:disulfide interchange protein DsbE